MSKIIINLFEREKRTKNKLTNFSPPRERMGQFMEVGEGGGRSLSRGILGRGGGAGGVINCPFNFQPQI